MTQKLKREPIDISIAIAQAVTDCPEDVCPECLNKIMEIARRKLETNHLSIVEIAKQKLKDTRKWCCPQGKNGQQHRREHTSQRRIESKWIIVFLH